MFRLVFIAKASLISTMLFSFGGCRQQVPTNTATPASETSNAAASQLLSTDPPSVASSPSTSAEIAASSAVERPTTTAGDQAVASSSTSAIEAPSLTSTSPEPSDLASTQPSKDLAVNGSSPQPTQPPAASTVDALKVADPNDFSDITLSVEADAPETIQFLGKVDKTLQALLVAAQAGKVSKDEAMRQAATLSQKKLGAAEQLKRVASEPLYQELAILAQMEGLSHLASLGDAPAASQLQQLVSDSSGFTSPPVRHQAALVTLGMYLSDYAAGVKTDQAVLDQLDGVLSETDLIKLPDFHAAAQVVQVFEQHANATAAEAARAKVFKAFENHSDPQIAMKTWYLRFANDPRFTNLNLALSNADSPVADVDRLVKELLQVATSQWTLAYLAQQIVPLETMGQTDKAGVLATLIQENENLLSEATLRNQVAFVVRNYATRVAAIGQPVSLAGLTLIQDNKAADIIGMRGKVVLIDFWASDCAPCRAEMPHLRECYAKYREEGFEIVGVNVDVSIQAMQDYLQSEPLPWIIARTNSPNQNGLATEAATSLGVTSIPYAVLLGRDGNVAAINARGTVLDSKLKELFGR